jgi:hypothetical protein
MHVMAVGVREASCFDCRVVGCVEVVVVAREVDDNDCLSIKLFLQYNLSFNVFLMTE